MGTLVLAGRYEIIEKIGDGGMAVVYKARDKQLNRFVAIKILKKEFISDQIFVENFIKEAKAAASLLHPNIVTIHDAGRDRDIYYIVMEYVEGRALSELIATEAPLDYKRCIRIAKQVASALSLAHRNNIIHRDVKPHNILITPDGTAKITDFGIAKAVSDGTIINDSGIIMGSVHYFSPEQSRGQYVDEKSDIYSLGIVLYEMITGRVPFDADNPVTIAVMHMNDTIIPPSRLVKGVPPGLDQIVMKATAKYQSDRFSNIDEMYKALDNVNFITGIIDDPVIAGYVKPTDMVEEDPGHGYSNATPPEETYDDEPFDDFQDLDDSDYYVPPPKKSVDEVYDSFEDDDNEKKRMAGAFAMGAGSAAAASEAAKEKKDTEDGKGKSKLTKKQKTILIIAAIAIAVALSFPLSKLLIGMFASEPVEVPDVVGLYVEEATDILQEAGFSSVIDIVPLPPVQSSYLPAATEDMTEMTEDSFYDPEPIYSDEPEFREGQVMEQDPEGGTLAKAGSQVKLKVAGPPEEMEDDPEALGEPTEVPDLLGKTKANAEYAIKSAGFRIGLVNYDNSELPIDTVIAQTPKAGEMAPGNSRIGITISLGPKEELVTIPNLVGMMLADANTLAGNSKFRINVKQEDFSTTVKRGAIISQEPPQGSSIPVNGVVDVIVSRGSNQITSVAVNPRTPSVVQGGTVQFTATVTGVGDVITDVTWSVSGGSISTSGNFSSAGLAPGVYTITAKSTVANVSGTATVTVTAPPTPGPWTVTFAYPDVVSSAVGNVVITTITDVPNGTGVTAPAIPGPVTIDTTIYTFTGWDVAFSNVTSNLRVTLTFTTSSTG